jgi:hypothetical protein
VIIFGVLLIAAGAAAYYYLIFLPAEKNIASRKVYKQWTLEDTEQSSKKVNLTSARKLPAIPDDYEVNNYYTPFEFLLSEEFVEAGDPWLIGMEAWFDAVNLDGIQFTFYNGVKDVKTEIYGLTTDKAGTPVYTNKVEMNRPVASV